MKSFADWTQELAESVGEVKHHWEEKTPEADPCEICGGSTKDRLVLAYSYHHHRNRTLCSPCYISGDF